MKIGLKFGKYKNSQVKLKVLKVNQILGPLEKYYA